MEDEPSSCDAVDCGSGDREARKRAEKKRRTVLNNLVGELAALLPLVAESSRKIDKTGVLRLAAHEIRKTHVFGDSVAERPFGYAVVEAFLDAMDGFMLTLNARGIVVVASPNVSERLGFAHVDVLGRSAFDFAHADDARALAAALRGGRPGERRDLVVRFARGAGEPQRLGGVGAGTGAGGAREWCACRLTGAFRAADRACAEPGPPRRQRARRDRRLAPKDNDVVFVALARPLPPPEPLAARRPSPNEDEYWTRHLVDGRIVHCDSRMSLVSGYFAEEVVGVCGFSFMHKEDVRWIIIALRQMYDTGNSFGESCYRLQSRTGEFIYLRTRGFLEVDPVTKVAQSFVCVNTLVPKEEGARTIDDLKRRFSAIVALDDEERKRATAESSDEASLEDPNQLEQVIMHLISDLPSPVGSVASPVSIVAPQPSAVKLSIEKCLSVRKRANGRSGPPPKRQAYADVH